MSSSRKTASLSLCMIVKDEELYLKECLESVKEVVDQIVIVDTGSIDNTKKIAKEFGAEVYDFKWCDDFSAARNESIKHANGEWILWLDADERLLPESVSELRKVLKYEPQPVIYTIHIRNRLADETNYSLSSAHRLFNNYQGIYFSGRIHEQVSPSVAQLKGAERNSHIYLYHLGYSFKGVSAEKKSRRNRKLLKKMVADSPQNAYAHFTLAQHYILTGEPSKALKQFRVANNLNQFDPAMTASLLNTMSEALLKLNRPLEARKKAIKSVRMKPLQAGGYYLLYKVAMAEGNSIAAIEWLEKLLTTTRKLKRERKTISSDVIIDETKILFTMGGIYHQLGQLDKAINCFEKVLPCRPDNITIIEALVKIYLQKGALAHAEKYLKRLNKLSANNPEYLETLGTVLIKQQKYQEAIAIYERIVSRIPENGEAAKRLVGLYGKTGNLQKAKELLSNNPASVVIS